ncbi:MAG: hypothetical protein R3B13_27565 [Polyangiaceae bacterium]
MKHFRHLHGLALAAALGGCSSSPPDEQVIAGRASLVSFPAPLTEVQAVRPSGIIARSKIGTDGSFELTVPPGAGYQLVFVGASNVPLVFPRSTGGVDTRFDIRAGGKAFDLGAVRYIGDPGTRAYVFGGVSPTPRTLAGSTAGANDVECEDGTDTNTGAVCVDDEDEEGAGVCEDGEGDGVDCVDGIDPATGLECDGGPAANANDGAEASGAEAETPTEAAVADHNLPAAMGCEEDDEE